MRAVGVEHGAGLRRRLAAASLLLLPGLAYGACPGVDPAALQWLERMSRSIHQASYHGVVTLQRSNRDLQVMQVARLVDGETSSEQLIQLTGQGARVDRSGHPLDCVHPGHELLRVGSQVGAGDCGVSESYRFSVGGAERIAGRNAVRIQVEPRDMYRFGYVMSLDRDTGLLLKTETVERGGRVLEKYQFASLSYGDSLPGTTEVETFHRARHPHPAHSSAGTSVQRDWAVSWLPRGFTPTDSPAPRSGRRTYTDGLAVFSVFLEDLEREMRPGEGTVREGGTTSYTRGMTRAGQPVLVTVIGEVPVNTARMVADSVHWVE